MAGIKVHGSPLSTATCRVLACLYEKELNFEFVPVDMGAGEHKTESFLSLNPFGQVPAFEDGDLKLFESRAITQYISQEYANKGTPLEYQDSKKNANLFVWKEVEAQKFDQPSSKLTWELAIKPALGMKPDLAVVEESEPNLLKVLDVYECQLTKSKYLAGDCFTLADLHHLPNIQSLIGTRSEKLFEARPHVSAWIADITKRSAWSKVLALKNKA